MTERKIFDPELIVKRLSYSSDKSSMIRRLNIYKINLPNAKSYLDDIERLLKIRR